MIRATMGWAAEVVPDPDAILAIPGRPRRDRRCRDPRPLRAWVNLARLLVEAGVPGAFVVDLG